MPAKLAVVLLDAAEASLLEVWSDDGTLPAIAALRGGGVHCRLATPMDTLPGAVWHELNDSFAANRQGCYYHPRQLQSGTAHFRRITEADIDPLRHFWHAASRAGLRTAVIDAPYAARVPDLNGIQLLEWAIHEPEFGLRCDPPVLIEELDRRHGRHPVSEAPDGVCDRYPKTRAGYEWLLADLETGLDRREAVYLDVMGREPWDLFVCGIVEAHCVGHHFWHFHDPEHPTHDPAAPERLRNAVRSVYRRIDRLVGALVEAAGPEATVLLVAPKGMTAFTGGLQLLPEVVARLGLSSGATTGRSLLREAQSKVKQIAPKGLYPLLRRIARAGPLDRAQKRAGASLEPFESAETRAAAVPNNRIGAIRLNLKGREPHGSVEPGAEARGILERLRDELLALRLAGGDGPAVHRVILTEELYGAERHPDLPDLLVEFRQDAGPIETVHSPSLGTISRPFGALLNHRSGDHTTSAMMIAGGPGCPTAALADGRVIDVAPTVLDLLGVIPPNSYEGRSLLQRASAAA